MWIILWIIQSFIASLWMIMSKKALENKEVWNNLQTFFSRTNHTIVVFLLYLFSIFIFNVDFFDININNSDITTFNIFIFVASTFALYTTYPLRRIAYANEKVSTLQPFAMLFQVFPVIFWFIFIASERANLVTFLMAILASLIVIWFSIDFKKFKINKYSLMVLTSSTIKSVQIFAIIYMLTFLTPSSLYLIESIFIIFISLFLMFINKEFWEFKLITKKYFNLLWIATTLGIISIILSLTMYKTLWVVTTSLLSLLYLVFIYFFWSLILWEKASKKDVLITIFVSICIVVWMLFKA